MALACLLAVVGFSTLKPTTATQPVLGDPDDIAIWRNETNPARSIVVGTDKEKGLYTFDLKGTILSYHSEVDHPNNVDIEYGFRAGLDHYDVAVATERGKKRLRIYRIVDGVLKDVSGRTDVFVGEAGPSSECMGIALYKRPTDGAVFAFVSRKEPGSAGYVWQYRLQGDSLGKVDLVKVREVGYGIKSEVEALAVDDELGYVYLAEEVGGIYKYHADPEEPNADLRLATFGLDGFLGEREGLAVAAKSGGKGFIFCSDQIKDQSQVRVYSREGSESDRNDHSRLVAVLETGADETDGLDVDPRPLPGYPNGILICMNSKGKNFLYYRLPKSFP